LVHEEIESAILYLATARLADQQKKTAASSYDVFFIETVFPRALLQMISKCDLLTPEIVTPLPYLGQGSSNIPRF
jgi:hypothetical protein